MFTINKKYFFIYIMLLISTSVFSVEKDKYLYNSHYKPLVEKLEASLLGLNNVTKVNVYKATPPYPFTPDLFSIEIMTSNGHNYILECIPINLNFYKSLSRIRKIDGIEYVTLKKSLRKEYSDRGIVLSKITRIKTIPIKNLKEFFENEVEMYKCFTQSQDDIQLERNANIRFVKING